MHLPDEPEVPTQINIVPMIDVMLAILAFFMDYLSIYRKNSDRNSKSLSSRTKFIPSDFVIGSLSWVISHL